MASLETTGQSPSPYVPPARMIEVRQIDKPNARPVTFNAPPGLRTCSDLRKLISSYDRARALAAGLVLRVFDDATQQYVLRQDHEFLPQGKGPLRIALQRSRTSTNPLGSSSTDAQDSVARPQQQAQQQQQIQQAQQQQQLQQAAQQQQQQMLQKQHAEQLQAADERVSIAEDAAQQATADSVSLAHNSTACRGLSRASAVRYSLRRGTRRSPCARTFARARP